MGLGFAAGACFLASAFLGPKLAVAGLLFLGAGALVVVIWLFK